ncbi:zinc ribbon domain-containing protein [Oryzomonas rubra]|uniref:Uncharacterized protein n=1 Tax=Oryzomonas rubra TaxID=2509454 RepID=A0A5A9X8X2_9BACT|nr:zinc ribbon domain-containing protein [Oryzomonas rubra]KAA0888081.1 hypothetical protein ET418_16915 [Oryzomonas rubra]
MSRERIWFEVEAQVKKAAHRKYGAFGEMAVEDIVSEATVLVLSGYFDERDTDNISQLVFDSAVAAGIAKRPATSEKICPQCGSIHEYRNKICTACGADLDGAERMFFSTITSDVLPEVTDFYDVNATLSQLEIIQNIYTSMNDEPQARHIMQMVMSGEVETLDEASGRLGMQPNGAHRTLRRAGRKYAERRTQLDIEMEVAA